MFLRSLVCEIGFGMWRTIYRAASAFVPTSSEPAARMPLLHAKEVAEKVGTRLPYGRGSESARRVYSHLLSRDRQGAVVLVLFQQPLNPLHRGTFNLPADARTGGMKACPPALIPTKSAMSNRALEVARTASKSATSGCIFACA